MEDEELLSLFTKISNDSIKAEIVARTYLKRGQKEGDTIKMARGYDRLARIFHPEKNIQFADSVIELTKHFNHKTYPAMGYILKGYEYNYIGDLVLATKNQLKAYNLALKNDNITQQLYILHNLIGSKAVWGNKRDALNLQFKRHELLNRKNNLRKIKESTRKGALVDVENLLMSDELSSIMNFTYCYINLRMIDSAKVYVKKGMEMSYLYKGLNDQFFKDWFAEASIEIDYFSKEFQRAIKSCNNLLRRSQRTVSTSSELNLYFYMGLSFIELGNYKTGIHHLQTADSIFNNGDVLLLPNQRRLFEELLEYHSSTNNTQKQIEYLNKLLLVDSVFKKNYQYFEPDLIKNFETPRLLREKEELISSLEKKNKNAVYKLWWGSGFLILTLLTLLYNINRQLLFKKRFKSLMATQSSKNENDPLEKGITTQISSKIIEDILSSLENFETNKLFLSQNLSLHNLASSIGTNPRYLSKVINLQKDKNFCQYINDLRVDYALKELAENTKFRKFTIKAIAGDCGFKSGESFSKAFYKRHGLYPSYYIKKLVKRFD